MSHELNPGLPCEWQAPNLTSHRLLPPGVYISRKLTLDAGTVKSTSVALKWDVNVLSGILIVRLTAGIFGTVDNLFLELWRAGFT